MSDTEKEELIVSFCSVTGVEPTRGRLYLESAGWNLDLSLSSFYEESDEIDLDTPPATQQPMGEQQREEEMQSADVSTETSSKKSKDGGGASKSSRSSNRIATLSTLNKDESSEDEGAQTFYAGGSERSGQQIIGPPSNKKDIISEMFKSAKEHGAQVLDPSSLPPSGGRAPTQLFRGAGHKLGSTENDSECVGVATSSTAKPNKPVDMMLRLWKNGFSVDNGPIREYADPTNKEFLDSITRGEIPRELVRQSRGVEVSLNMEDHRHEEFNQPKVKVQAFAGEGHRLGSPSPLIASTNQSAAVPLSPSDLKDAECSAQSAMNVDDTQPTTNIQIRLADGSRVVARLNHNHNVQQLRTFINICRPQFSSSVYCLLTGFPTKEIEREEQSVKEADLLNAAIVQRLN